MIIKLENFKLYSQVASSVRYMRRDKQYMVTYFSENSTLFDDYPKLGIKPQDLRYVLVPLTKLPRTGLTPQVRSQYKRIKMSAYQSNMIPPRGQNMVYDTSLFIDALDKFLHPMNYRTRAGNLVKNSVYRGLAPYPDFTRVLIYSVDVSKPIDKNIANRKIFPFLKDIKSGNIPFDYFILCIISGDTCRYRLLLKDGDFNFTRLYMYIRYIKSHMSPNEIENVDSEIEKELEVDEKEIDSKAEKEADKMVSTVKDHISPDNKDKVKYAVKSYLKKNDSVLWQAEKDKLSNNEIGKTVLKSVIYKATDNIKHAEKVVNKIPEKKVGDVLKKSDKIYADQILVKKDAPSTTKDILIGLADVPRLVDNKNPSHLFEKRAIDFETNLRNDIVNSFRVLESKEIPLKIQFFEIVDKPSRRGDIEPSDINTVIVKLKDLNGNVHDILIDIPKIDVKSGIFRIGGRTKCLLNQIVLCPISFPKPYDSKFESSFSKFHIYSKITKTKSYLEIYFASFKKLPFLAVLSYMFGFEKSLKDYDIGYKISNEIPSKTDIFYTKIDDELYLYFENVDTELKRQVCLSLMVENISQYKITSQFGTKEYWDDLLQDITGSVNISYLITNNLENVIDPTTKQVLITKNLPIDLDLIMKYMATKVVEGFTEDRNDLSNQRIRGSEIITYILYKEINTAYTVYREQILAGNKNAKFMVPRNNVLSIFNRTELVTDMEYANPVEEMAAITKISPIGKRVGGIATVDAVPSKARNVHNSYYGNIDPLDTPEGGTIGVNQQLAMGADITNARGIFKPKPMTDDEKSGILSTSSSLVPFIGNNDGARIIMADSQIKQMLPLKDPDPPVVMTGYESILTSMLSDNFVKTLPYDCEVVEVTRDYILVKTKEGKLEQVSLTPVHLRSGFGRDTLSVFIPKVVKGQVIKKGQIMAEGSCIKDGTISLGRTLLCAYMVYKGYNYEDGIVISEKLVENDKLTSLHGMIEEVEISEKDRVLYIANIGDYIEKGKPLIRKTIGELEELLGYEEDESSVVYGQDYIRKSQGGRIVDIEVFCNSDISAYPLLKELSNRTRARYKMGPNEKFSQRSKSIKGTIVRFKIQQELKIKLGDKLSGRYGNKGVICLIEKEENMPRCYDKETEIFTRNGWKKFSDLLETDEVAYIKDMNNLIADFTKPISKFSKHYTGTMYGAESKRIDYLVTHHHRMYCKTKYEKFNKNNEFTIQLAEDIHNKNVYHLANIQFDLIKEEYNDKVILENITNDSGKKCKNEFNRKDFCEFLGWFISEGSLACWKSNKEYKHGKSFSYKIQISQYKNVHSDNCKEIEELLNRMGLKWNYDGKQYTISNKSIYFYLEKLGKCNEKYIPIEILKESNKDDLVSMFNSLIKGDGSDLKNGKFVYYTTSLKLANDMSTLCSLLGYHCSSPTISKKGRKLEKYTIYIYTQNNIELSVNKKQYYKKEYDDMIYCVEVPNGLILVRRNGKQFWCGNTPWGESVDIILNPIGVLGRMNIGQIYELYCGLIARDMAVSISKMTNRQQVINLFKKVLPKLDMTKNKEYSTKTIIGLEKLSDKKFLEMVTKIRTKGFSPIIVPPFKSPNYNEILEVLNVLGLKTGYRLYLPEFNTLTKEEVPVGYSYITKLEHMAELKIHSRSTGPMTVMRQPTRGKRHAGGQRLGEADTYSLIGYNAIHLLSELMGPMSDDEKSKNEMLSEIITTGKADFKIAKESMARDLMASFFVALMLDER